MAAGLHRPVMRAQVVVGSGSLEATLQAVAACKPARPLAITDASRGDLIVGLAAAHASAAGPHVSAILAADADDPQAIGPHSAAILRVLGTPGLLTSATVAISRMTAAAKMLFLIDAAVSWLLGLIPHLIMLS